MASEDQPSKFLSQKFGDPPPAPEQKVAWDDEDVLNFIAQVTAPKQPSDHAQELEKIQAVHQRRDELIHQLEISWELSHLDNVTKLQTWFIENQHQADTLIHLRTEMFDALDQACDLFTDALDHARHRLQSKQAETTQERETRERTRRQRAEAADREYELQRRRRQEDDEKHQQETQARLQAFIDKDRCRQCNAVTGPGMRFCHTCASGLGPKSKNCPNCGKMNGLPGSLCFSCARS